MSNELRRFEILLPLRFNDGQPVPEELVTQTVLEIEEQFGGVSTETQVIRGYWRHEGTVFRDDLVRVFVDVGDSSGARQFFKDFKERLKARFQQVDIYLRSYAVESL